MGSRRVVACRMAVRLPKNVCRIVAVAFLSWAFWVPLCGATTIIITIERNRIVFGADSLLKGTIAGHASICKIHADPSNCIFTIAGLHDSRAAGFDASTFAIRACKAKSSPTERARVFGEIVRPALERAVRRSDYDYHGILVLEVLFAGFDGDRPSVVSKSFHLDKNSNVLIEGGHELPALSFSVSGVRDAAQPFLNSHIGMPSASLARASVEAQIRASPDKVAPPINVLIIEKNGYHWDLPSETCAPN